MNETESIMLHLQLEIDNHEYWLNEGRMSNPKKIKYRERALKRWFKYFFADKRNFIELCFDCHQLAEGTMRDQKKLNCFKEMEKIAGKLLKEYYRFKAT